MQEEKQRKGEAITVVKRGKSEVRAIASPAGSVESVFGRQKESMTILGDIVSTDDVYADGLKEMENEWRQLYRRK